MTTSSSANRSVFGRDAEPVSDGPASARQMAAAGQAPSAVPTELAIVPAPTTTGLLPRVASPLAAAFAAPEKASADTSSITSEAAKVLERAGLRFVQGSDGWYLATDAKRIAAVLVGPRGPLRASGSRSDDGVVRLRVATGRAEQRTVEFDSRARTLRALGEDGTVQDQDVVGYSRTELLSLYAAVQRGEPGSQALGSLHRVDGRALAALRRLFGDAGGAVLENMPYVRLVEGNGLGPGGYGATTLNRCFVAPDADDVTVANELSSLAWRRLIEQAFDRNTPPHLRDDDDVHRRVFDDVMFGNWFAGSNEPAFAHIHSNIQAEELVSDAASIGVDTRDLYRILGFHGRVTISDGYFATVHFAREVVAVINGGRAVGKMDPAGLVDLLDTGSEAEIERQLALTPNELEQARAAYQNAGHAIVSHYAAELNRRYPRRRTPGPRG